MEKTASPLPQMREPRDQTQGPDWDSSDRSRAIPAALTEVSLQVMREQLYLSA